MSERSHLLYIIDIIDAAQAIFTYTAEVDFIQFSNDRMRYSAVIREFEIIGEAVYKLQNEIRETAPDVKWQDIKDFRNLLVHQYSGIDLEIVWNVVKEDLPGLYQAVLNMKKKLY